MLERAAGCLESAGRRFFRDSNGAIRSPRPLYPNFGQTSGTNTECPQWFPVPLNSPGRVSTGTSSANRATHECQTPFLDFLYPPQAQEFAVSCLLRSPRRLAARRRRKAISNFARTYTSGAASLHQTAGVEKSDPETSDYRDIDHDREQAKCELLSLLAGSKLEEYDQAWSLYVSAGHPLEMNSALLAGLSDSEQEADHKRAKRLFEGIPEDSRSADDYLHMAKSHVAFEKVSDVSHLCQQAINKGLGAPCWAFSFVHFLSTTQLDLVQQAWGIGPISSDDELWGLIASHLIVSDVSKSLIALATYLQGQPPDSSAWHVARFLLKYFFVTPNIVESTPTDSLLLLLKEYNSLSILTPKHYFDLIRTLQESEIRSNFVRSIVVYRNFRWQMENEVPPAKLLGQLMRCLTKFEITTGIRYLLDELTLFYRKPSIDAYKHALIAFSRAGDVLNVDQTFERFLSDHGKPSSRRLLTPLLHVHARYGNVQETLRQFNRISEEFGMEPNAVCWNILLTAYTNAGDLSGSFTTFKKMIQEGVEPDSHTFGTLMGLCANRGDIDTVRQLLALAKRRRVQITAPFIDAIVEAYCNNQNLEMAESVAETCLGLEVKGSRVRMWNVLLWNYAFRMDLDSVSRARSRMDAAGIQPDGMTYAALMLTLVLLRQTDSARRILRTLHRSHRMYATEFHYTIILYGYVKDRNRDMVHILFREIKERFDRPGVSSSLLMLKSQLQRDLQLVKSRNGTVYSASVRLENAEKFLAKVIADFDTTKLATKQPSPGVGKQPLSEAFPAMYYEYMITAYGTRGVFAKIQELFDRYIKDRQASSTLENVDDMPPLRLLSALMLAYLKADQYEKVEECWNLAVSRAKSLARRPSIDEWLSSQFPSTDIIEPPRPDSANYHKNILFDSDPLVDESTEKSPILPTFRFMLSRPLSLYMRSLAYRNDTGKISETVVEVEKAGFKLTTYNWSTWVQMLASSENKDDQYQAFNVFEERFIPNFPGWKNLRRGYGIKPPGVPPGIDNLENPKRGKHPDVLGKEGRRYWSKLQPDFMQPTYVSTVYLAAALAGFRERSIVDGGAEVSALHDLAPKTIATLAEMPYLRDKFQGVLLRRREEQGDLKDVDGPEHFVWTGGILGVGGRRRRMLGAEQAYKETLREEKLAKERAQAENQSTEVSNDQPFENDHAREEVDVQLPEKTIDYADEYDIEAESLLETKRNLQEDSDEMLDSEHHAANDEEDLDESSEMTDEELAEEDEEDIEDDMLYEAQEEAQEEIQEEIQKEIQEEIQEEIQGEVQNDSQEQVQDEVQDRPDEDVSSDEPPNKPMEN
ncbi:hypothetical protein BDV25DRAFT_165319 [Aspergillus avenaceus]|uniref:Translation regulator (Cya5) n=1 Tax=Aspergillus avenaceus TaxID=36643 RepID=A0A5N6TFH6_ASPAV|nr:hypothetical protein BDV25DRAFT_165319 [Aspergillus avenaceus]